MKHGSWRYSHPAYACRCLICTKAKSERAQVDRETRKRRLQEDPTLVAHGKDSTYRNWGCRCEPCRAAHSLVMKAYKTRRRNARVNDDSRSAS